MSIPARPKKTLEGVPPVAKTTGISGGEAKTLSLGLYTVVNDAETPPGVASRGAQIAQELAGSTNAAQREELAKQAAVFAANNV